MFDCIIVGSGPAGISAALYLKRANKKVLLIDNNAPGGKLLEINKIDNYPSYNSIEGTVLASKLYEQIINSNIDLKIENVISVTNDLEVITNSNTYRARFIILATGRNIKTLNLENEDKFKGKGISYCTVCDGPMYKDLVVGIVGNTKKTLEECLFLTNMCKKVYLFSDKLDIKNESVEIIKEPIKELIGTDHLTKVITNKEIILDGLFIVDGINNTKYYLNNSIELDNGYIKVNSNYQTNVNNIYAIGDCIKKELYQIITAQADGAIAATNIIKQMKN